MGQRKKFLNPEFFLPFLFFFVLLIIGLFIYDDYGISWDEPLQHQVGLATSDYIAGSNNDLLGNDNCYLNPFIAWLEVLPEKLLNLNNERDIFLSRHLFNFLFCWVGLIFFYLLARKIFRHYHLALIACLIYILMPRLFAHCFYNSKDLPFLSLFIVNAFVLILWLEQPSWKKIMWLALCCGMLTGARIAGIFFPVILIVIAALGFLTQRLKMREIKMVIGYLMLYPVSVYIFFPTFWHHPFEQFLKAVSVMSHHPYEVTTFFMGETVSSLHTPWYYIPVWMAIIIPLGWCLLFLTGLAALAWMWLRSPKLFSLQWTFIILWLIFPVATQIILHSSTYDDGRHLFFTYPPLILIAVMGFQSMNTMMFMKKKVLSLLPSGIAWCTFLYTSLYLLVFMIQFHPFQYAYFNVIGRKYANDYFEKDYWGLSYRNALEYLVKYDRGSQLDVRWKVDPCEWNLIWLPDEDRKRINRVKPEDCTYYLTNYRSHHPADASDEKIYDLKVQGNTIMAVYKLHPPNNFPSPAP